MDYGIRNSFESSKFKFTSASGVASEISVNKMREVGSDHLPINIKADLAPLQMPIGKPRFNFRNVEHQREFPNRIKPSTLLRPNNLEHISDDFMSRIQAARDEVFSISNGSHKHRRSTCWWDRECTDAVLYRRRCRRIVERHPSEETLREYRKATTVARKLCSKKKRESFRNYISEIQFDTPLKEVWRKIRSIKSSYTPQTFPIVDDNDTLVQDSKAKADMFLQRFLSSSSLGEHRSPDDMELLINRAKSTLTHHDYNSEIEPHEVREAIMKARESSPGIDQIPYSLFKSLPEIHFEEITAIFNQSFATGCFPQTWKTGLVFPLLKPAKPKDKVKSYRPVTLLPCIGKIMERIIKNRLEYVCEKNCFLQPFQFGFRKQKTTIDVLVKLEYQIRRSLENRDTSVVVFIDLESAFDKVWHRGLIYKLCKLGIEGKMISFIEKIAKELGSGTSTVGKEIFAPLPIS